MVFGGLGDQRRPLTGLGRIRTRYPSYYTRLRHHLHLSLQWKDWQLGSCCESNPNLLFWPCLRHSRCENQQAINRVRFELFLNHILGIINCQNPMNTCPFKDRHYTNLHTITVPTYNITCRFNSTCCAVPTSLSECLYTTWEHVLIFSLILTHGS